MTRVTEALEIIDHLTEEISIVEAAVDAAARSALARAFRGDLVVGPAA
ncbi:MAG: hypothetical protein ACYC91_11395 [Solirubrobacteraceae bacterium]